MYDPLYNFTAEPFRLSPDPSFCYQHESFEKARRYLEYALKRAEGFIMVTGSPGTGKTTLVEDLVSRMNGSGPVLVRLHNTQLKPVELLRKVALSLGLPADDLDKAGLLHALEQFMEEQGRRRSGVLLIVDEAQALSASALEELRLLTNLQDQARPLIQIFLVGQPELRTLIRGPEMEQFHQRMIAACHLRQLEPQETRQYIAYRLGRVGWRGDPQFTARALAAVHYYAQGVPRRINQVCSRLLLHGAAMDKRVLDRQDVALVVEELKEESLAPLVSDTVYRGGQIAGLEPLGPEQPAAPASADAPGDQAAVTLTPAADGPAPEAAPAAPPVPGRTSPDSAAVAAMLGATPRAPHRVRARSWGRHRVRRLVGDVAALGLVVAVGAVTFIQPGLADTAREWLTDAASELRGVAERRFLPVDAGTGPAPERSESPARPAPVAAASMVPADEEPPPAVVTVARAGPAGAPVVAASRRAAEGDGSRGPGAPSGPGPPPASSARALAAPPGLPDGTTPGAVHREVEAPPPLAAVVPPTGRAGAPAPDRPPAGLDQLERELTALGVTVRRTGTRQLNANLRRQVPFGFDSAEIQPSSVAFLERLAGMLRDRDDVHLRIVGFTDPSGPADYNQFLSQLRAAAVARRLVALGVARDRIATEGRGGVAATTTPVPGEEAFDSLRRIELFISSPP